MLESSDKVKYPLLDYGDVPFFDTNNTLDHRSINIKQSIKPGRNSKQLDNLELSQNYVPMPNPLSCIESEIFMLFTVVEPITTEYTTYLITGKTNLPEYSKKEFSIRKRYSQIYEFKESLIMEGYKNSFDDFPPKDSRYFVRFMPEIIEERRLGFERFFNRLGEINSLRVSDTVMKFFEVRSLCKNCIS